MQPSHRLRAVALALSSLSACGQPKGYDQMNLLVEQVGEAPLSAIEKPPANVGDVTTWRSTFPGQVFAAVKTEAPCPRMIHTTAGVQFRKDSIELCFTAIPRAEPDPVFACSEVVYVKYEIMRVPAEVQPTFVFVGPCA